MSLFLDALDKEILRLLARNSTLTHLEVARMVLRSKSAVTERIKKLEEEKVIDGYAATIDYKRINDFILCYLLISIDKHDTTVLNMVKEKISAFDEVIECSSITGDYDFILKIAVNKMTSYNDFISNKLSTLPHLTKTTSLVVIDEFKRVHYYPIYD